MIEQKEGKISVNIQREEFTKAITAIAESNLMLAKALNAPPIININNCTITADLGISIASFDKSRIVEETTGD